MFWTFGSLLIAWHTVSAPLTPLQLRSENGREPTDTVHILASSWPLPVGLWSLIEEVRGYVGEHVITFVGVIGGTCGYFGLHWLAGRLIALRRPARELTARLNSIGSGKFRQQREFG